MACDAAIAVVWLVLTVAASSVQGELFDNLTLHGKLRKLPDFSRTSPRNGWLTLLVETTVPKRWFWHFYAVAAAVAVSLVDAERTRTRLVILLFLLHVLRRLAEELWLFEQKRTSTSRMHVLAYLLGLGFYPLVGLSVWASRPRVWTSSSSAIHVLCLWSVSQLVQFAAHHELARLRQGKSYGIPESWPFRLTWSPHYVAEVCIYVSFAWLSEGWATKACAVFVAGSLAVNGLNQRRWYEAKLKSGE